jgi:hypothetical protein
MTRPWTRIPRTGLVTWAIRRCKPGLSRAWSSSDPFLVHPAERGADGAPLGVVEQEVVGDAEEVEDRLAEVRGRHGVGGRVGGEPIGRPVDRPACDPGPGEEDRLHLGPVVATGVLVQPERVTDRTMRMRSTSRAIRGNSSDTRMPSTLVEIELSSPRISAGASGFMSQVSSCDGPPLRNTWMHRLALPNDGRGSPSLAEARDRVGGMSPAGQSRLAGGTAAWAGTDLSAATLVRTAVAPRRPLAATAPATAGQETLPSRWTSAARAVPSAPAMCEPSPYVSPQVCRRQSSVPGIQSGAAGDS